MRLKAQWAEAATLRMSLVFSSFEYGSLLLESQLLCLDRPSRDRRLMGVLINTLSHEISPSTKIRE
jgi:hypothetical protein